MKGFVTRLLITALGLWAADAIVGGLAIAGWQNLVIAALLLGIVNALVRPIIVMLTLPLTILTLGLFLLVVNGVSLWIVALLVPGVTVSGFGAAVLGAMIVSVVSWFASTFVGSSGRVERLRGIEVSGRRIE